MKKQPAYEQRTYRRHSTTPGLVSYTVSVKETDLFISTTADFSQDALKAVYAARTMIENHIKDNPSFHRSLTPLPPDTCAPRLIREMLAAASAANVGPMAAVAGAIAEYTGRRLLKHSREVIVENGGDIFLMVERAITVGIFAGTSPLSNRIGIRVAPAGAPTSVCTSSGTVGPSLSFGHADAVTARSPSAARADAAATAIANLIKCSADIPKGLDQAKKISGIDGILIIIGDKMGVWGKMELVTL